MRGRLNTIIVVTHDISAALAVADTLWLLGRDRDAQGILPGARIQAHLQPDRARLAWRKGIASTAPFLALRQEIRERFCRSPRRETTVRVVSGLTWLVFGVAACSADEAERPASEEGGSGASGAGGAPMDGSPQRNDASFSGAAGRTMIDGGGNSETSSEADGSETAERGPASRSV